MATTVDGSQNPAHHQGWWLYPIIYGVFFHHPRWWLGFLTIPGGQFLRRLVTCCWASVIFTGVTVAVRCSPSESVSSIDSPEYSRCNTNSAGIIKIDGNKINKYPQGIYICIHFAVTVQDKPSKWYCWWTKSCTTKDDDYTIIYRVLTIPGGAGFRPSTVRPILVSSYHIMDGTGWWVSISLKRDQFTFYTIRMHRIIWFIWNGMVYNIYIYMWI